MSPKDRQSQMRAATADVIAWQDHGDTKARARAIQSVEPMIWKMARQAHRRVGHLGVDLDDLVAAGREGATIATARFDRDRCAPFISAAWQSIRERISQTARHGSGVASINSGTKLASVEIAVNRAAAAGESSGMTPNAALEHAAAVVGISPVHAVALARRSHAVTWEAEKHDVRDDGEAEIVAHAASVAALIEDCLAELAPREADIVRSRFLRADPETFSDIGKRYGVSGERIRQNERRAMADLRTALRRRGLRLEDLL